MRVPLSHSQGFQTVKPQEEIRRIFASTTKSGAGPSPGDVEASQCPVPARPQRRSREDGQRKEAVDRWTSRCRD